jgi:hypothetical protein
MVAAPICRRRSGVGLSHLPGLRDKHPREYVLYTDLKRETPNSCSEMDQAGLVVILTHSGTWSACLIINVAFTTNLNFVIEINRVRM